MGEWNSLTFPWFFGQFSNSLTFPDSPGRNVMQHKDVYTEMLHEVYNWFYLDNELLQFQTSKAVIN